MSTLESIQEIETSLIIGEINDSGNSFSDYPSRRNQLGESDHVVIGFSNMAECKQFAARYSLNPIKTSIRNGNHFYSNDGFTDEPYSIGDYLTVYGDNSGIITRELLKEMLNDSSITTDESDKLISLLDKCPDGYELVWHGDFFNNDFVKNDLMEFTHDVTHYYIGVLIPYEQEA